MVEKLVEGEVEFYFEKSHIFRVIHVDGAIGAISPGNRLIHMSAFSERAPVPRKVVHTVTSGVAGDVTGGILGPEIIGRREVRPGVFREVEADFVFFMETAIALRAWLDDRIQESERLQQIIEGAQKSDRQ